MQTKTQAPYLRLAYAACLVLIFGLAWVSPVQAHTFGGRAFSAFVNVPPLGAGPVYISDTGELSPDGGWNGAGLLSTAVPNVLSADVLNAATSGANYETAGNKADSSTSLADIVVLPGNLAQVAASFVYAQAAVTAGVPQGSTQINDLTFGGVPVTVTGLPNQTVEIPGVAQLIINEQTVTSQGITVNALHLILGTGGEVILASAGSSIQP